MTSQLRPMTTCKQCGQENAEGYTVCSKCGHPSPLANVQPQSGEQLVYSLTFRVEGEDIPLTLVPSQRAMMGRQAPFMLQVPDVDLTTFNAAEHGISRVHAVVDCTRNGIQITDLDSRNGTFVNGERVHPFNAHVLRHGDAIRLGGLTLEVVITVERRTPPEPTPTPSTRTIPPELQTKVTRLLSLPAPINANRMSPVPAPITGNNAPTLNKVS